MGSILTVAFCLACGFAINWIVSFILVMHWALDSTIIAIFRQLLTPLIIAGFSALPLLAINHFLAIANPLLDFLIRLIAWGSIAVLSSIVFKEHRALLSLQKVGAVKTVT